MQLSSRDELIQDKLTKEEQRIFIERYKFAALFFAIPLVMSFSFVDYFFKPNLFVHFFIVRLSIFPIALGTYVLYKFKVLRDRLHVLPALIGIAYLGIFHAYLIHKTGYEYSIYFVGNIIATVAFFTFLTWPPKFLWLAHALNLSPYFFVMFYGGEDLSHLVPNMAFQISFAFICTVALFVTRNLRKNEITLRLTLEEQTKKQALIIDEKTQQGIYLEKLASQFSPQVVEAIRQGEINLERKTRREITTIFIDIENSTSRASRIDFVDYAVLVSDFFTMTTDVFLKHDVTVGTYLGDGILGFANAPKSQPAHAVNALNACAEILSIHKMRSQYYHTTWRTNFNIRIGVNTGYAYVGFFPNQKIGTYTALGESVNITARLCSLAVPNTICVQKPFILKNAHHMGLLQVGEMGLKNDIKGFEGESFELYSISPKVSVESINTQGSNCPLCASKVEQILDMGEVILARCTKCSYTDLVGETKKKAA